VLGPDDLVAWCRDGLAAFKRPRNIVVFDELPTTATGKLQRFRIRELAIGRLDGAASPDLTSSGSTA
jgi:acyl-CoA synthetase (AMP-forming)/AMP-acid ligase II